MGDPGRLARPFRLAARGACRRSLGFARPVYSPVTFSRGALPSLDATPPRSTPRLRARRGRASHSPPSSSDCYTDRYIKRYIHRYLPQWAGLALPAELFDSAYAERYAADGESSPRRPGAVKWKNFLAAIDYSKMQNMGKFLERQKKAEKDARQKAIQIRETVQAVEAAKAAAEKAAAAARKSKGPDVSDDELRRVHSTVKNKLLLQFGDIRRAFRAFDKDFSGTRDANAAICYRDRPTTPATTPRKMRMEGATPTLQRLCDTSQARCRWRRRHTCSRVSTSTCPRRTSMRSAR